MPQTIVLMKKAPCMTLSALIKQVKSLFPSLLRQETLNQWQKFLSVMPDWMEGIKEGLQKALDALPVPKQADGISIHNTIEVSSIKSTAPL